MIYYRSNFERLFGHPVTHRSKSQRQGTFSSKDDKKFDRIFFLVRYYHFGPGRIKVLVEPRNFKGAKFFKGQLFLFYAS